MKSFRNDMTNFGILMEIRGIDKPFEWSREVVKNYKKMVQDYIIAPSREPSQTSEGDYRSIIC